jgi:hypothetical protein
VSQDEYVTGVGDQFNGRVYRIAYTVSDDRGGSCSGTAGRTGNTTARVSVPRRKGT